MPWRLARRLARVTMLALSLVAVTLPAVAQAGGAPSFASIAAGVNTGGAAMLTAVSCPSTGQCAAGGFYTDASHFHEAFIVSESLGQWGKVQEVATLYNAGGNATVSAISCPAVNSCVAAGFFTDATKHHQAFVVEETNGIWGSTQEVAGTLNVGGDAVATAVSCAAAGSCVVGGRYVDGAGARRAFIVEETGGHWNGAVEVARALNLGGNAVVTSISCAAVGSCVVAGQYAPHVRASEAFVVEETNGLWAKPFEVAGSLNTGLDASITAVACPSEAHCVVGGSYVGATPGSRPFVVVETSGNWGAPITLGQTLHAAGAIVTALSCADVGDCAAGGEYTTTSGATLGFVANDTAGTWGHGQPIAQSTRSPSGTYDPVIQASVQTISCSAAGQCEAGGQIHLASNNDQAFVAVEQQGSWGVAQPVAQIQNVGRDAIVLALSCADPADCVAAGRYTNRAKHYQAFVATGFDFLAPQLVVAALRGSVPPTGAATLVLSGGGFSSRPSVRSGEAGASVTVVSVTPTRLVISLRVTKDLPGRHVLTIVEAGQAPVRITYVQR